MLPGFQDVSKALVADTVVVVKDRHIGDRHIGEWSRTETYTLSWFSTTMSWWCEKESLNSAADPGHACGKNKPWSLLYTIHESNSTCKS